MDLSLFRQNELCTNHNLGDDLDVILFCLDQFFTPYFIALSFARNEAGRQNRCHFSLVISKVNNIIFFDNHTSIKNIDKWQYWCFSYHSSIKTTVCILKHNLSVSMHIFSYRDNKLQYVLLSLPENQADITLLQIRSQNVGIPSWRTRAMAIVR